MNAVQDIKPNPEDEQEGDLVDDFIQAAEAIEDNARRWNELAAEVWAKGLANLGSRNGDRAFHLIGDNARYAYERYLIALANRAIREAERDLVKLTEGAD